MQIFIIKNAKEASIILTNSSITVTNTDLVSVFFYIFFEKSPRVFYVHKYNFLIQGRNAGGQQYNFNQKVLW